MKRIGCCVMIMILLICVACTQPSKIQENFEDEALQLNVLNVYIAHDLESYTVVRALHDDIIRKEIEENLNMKINLFELEITSGLERVTDINFSGVLLTDNPLWIVPLVEHGRLMELGYDLLITEPQFGRYRGKQYGYVYMDSGNKKSQPFIAVIPEVLESKGIENIPFTPESLLEALRKLSDITQTPLAVYGSPIREGFSVLMELFDVSASGGSEFYVEDGQVVYDKLSFKGEDYLAYVNQLYNEALIPSDFLVLNEYSVIEMLEYGKSAMAILSGDDIIKEVMRRADQKDSRVALVQLPVENSCVEMNIYARLTGLISKDCENADLIKQFLIKLQNVSEKITQNNELVIKDWYPLFSDQFLYPRTAYDPVEVSLPDLRRLYEKNTLDTSYIEPYYCRIAVGDLPLSAFISMKEQWLMKYGEPYDAVTSGHDILELFRRWHNVKLNPR